MSVKNTYFCRVLETHICLLISLLHYLIKNALWAHENRNARSAKDAIEEGYWLKRSWLSMSYSLACFLMIVVLFYYNIKSDCSTNLSDILKLPKKHFALYSNFTFSAPPLISDDLKFSKNHHHLMLVPCILQTTSLRSITISLNIICLF